MKNLIVISDTHINSTVGLCDEQAELDDGGVYIPSKSQKWLKSKWDEFCAYCHNLEGERIYVLNGDVLDINKHSKHQLITSNCSSVIAHAETLITQLVNGDKTFLIRGTEAHVGQSGELEDILATRLYADEIDGRRSHWQLVIDVNGVLFDITHHGMVGNKPWNKYNTLATTASEMIINSVQYNQLLPHVVIRSHRHTHADTHDNFPVRIISAPAWQLSTAFSYRIGTGMADIGGLVFRCEDGKYELIKKLYRPAINKVMVV